MNWKRIVGRAIHVVIAGAVLVFAVTQTTPEWWAGLSAALLEVAAILLGTVGEKA